MYLEKLQSNFLLRRLHSLSGLFPIGVFMMFHLFANSAALQGPEKFNIIINFLRSLPFLEAVEFTVLFVPIAFHVLYGILITTTARPTHTQYSNIENWRYILQRMTGMIGVFYVAYHIFQFRLVEHLDYDFVAKSLAGGLEIPFLPELPILNPMSMYWFYIIGVVSLVFHLANGLWGFCITWGITVGKKSQDFVTYIGIGLFIIFSYISVTTINHLADAGKALL